MTRAQRIRDFPVIHAALVLTRKPRDKNLPFKAHTVAGGCTHMKAFGFDVKGLTYHVCRCDAMVLFCEVRW